MILPHVVAAAVLARKSSGLDWCAVLGCLPCTLPANLLVMGTLRKLLASVCGVIE